MSFNTTDYLSYKVLHLTGEVDLSNSSVVRKHLLKILADNHSVIVDFKELEYIDSSGIATLVEGLNVAKKSNLKLIIASVNGAPKQALELTRLNQVFTMAESIEAVTE